VNTSYSGSECCETDTINVRNLKAVDDTRSKEYHLKSPCVFNHKMKFITNQVLFIIANAYISMAILYRRTLCGWAEFKDMMIVYLTVTKEGQVMYHDMDY
jgi:hypothetical protein